MGILDTWPATARQTLVSASTQKLQSNSSSGSTDPMLIAANRKYLVQITQAQDIPTINSDGSPIIVVGQVPESFQMDQQSQWKAPWGAGLAGDNNISDLLAVTMGTRLLAQVQTIQVWQGSTGDVEFTLEMDFRAWSDSDRDVMIPLQNLASLALPSVDPSTGWLRSPGPILDEDAVRQIGSGITGFVLDSAELAGSTFVTAIANGQSYYAGAVNTAKALADKTGKALASAKDEIENLLKNKIEIRIGDWFRMKNAIVKNVQHTMNPQIPSPDGGLMYAKATVTFSPMFALTTADLRNLLQTSSLRLQNAMTDAADASRSFSISNIGVSGAPTV